MSIRNLDSLFDPSSVAVLGVSQSPGSVGATVWKNLRSSNFKGTLLTEPEAEAVLDACQIPVVLTQRVDSNAQAAVKAAQLLGFPVQAMIQRKHAQELIVGSTVDPVFGPVILFGQGGPHPGSALDGRLAGYPSGG